jgi:hypothetical protein
VISKVLNSVRDAFTFFNLFSCKSKDRIHPWRQAPWFSADVL